MITTTCNNPSQAPGASRWLVLGIVSVALLLIVIDMTVLYTALPRLTHDLAATASAKLWIINSYSLVVSGLLLGMGVLLATRRQQSGGERPRFTPTQFAAMSSAFALIGSCGLLYFSGFTFWVQDYPRGGNLVGLLLADVLFLAATVPFGLWIGSFFDMAFFDNAALC